MTYRQRSNFRRNHNLAPSNNENTTSWARTHFPSSVVVERPLVQTGEAVHHGFQSLLRVFVAMFQPKKQSQKSLLQPSIVYHFHHQIDGEPPEAMTDRWHNSATSSAWHSTTIVYLHQEGQYPLSIIKCSNVSLLDETDNAEAASQ